MKSVQKILNTNSNNLISIPDKSVHLIVTSPPYPMIEMWDDIFAKQDPSIAESLNNGAVMSAFNKMHDILMQTWKECDRVLIDGGFVCINIGDATRTFNDTFQLFSNHTKIIEAFLSLGYCVLPDIHWCKRTNSPNKFMGSGMYPAGAYVTYEHEYILIFRKGDKRKFNNESKLRRQESAYFWEERNVWFSDIWEIAGTKQILTNADRTRNGSYPFEIPYRLINMYSIYGDTVLDPFAGLGTTNLACIVSGRNGIGVDISSDICNIAIERLSNVNIEEMNKFINTRIEKHANFIDELIPEKKAKCYQNESHKFDVKTKQETKLKLYKIENITKTSGIIESEYRLL